MKVRSFFFQAEDGIRDLVRSRGLGDVYKRQRKNTVIFNSKAGKPKPLIFRTPVAHIAPTNWLDTVSYTHLTLPTSDLV